MQWFKLYGAEMLADPKYQRLNASERSCWITLLCLASLNDGIIKHCEESYLITHSGVDVSDLQKAHGILIKLEMLGMIKKGRDNEGIEYIVIINWRKRQENRPMTGYERLKKHREKAKLLAYDNDLITDDNGKNRLEENRIDNTLATKVASPMKKNSFRYTEDQPSDAFEDVIDADTGSTRVEVKGKSTNEKFWDLLKWAEERRGSKFLKSSVKKQFKAMSIAKQEEISINRLKGRWAEFEVDKFRIEHGFDWMDVVLSFNKKA